MPTTVHANWSVHFVKTIATRKAINRKRVLVRSQVHYAGRVDDEGTFYFNMFVYTSVAFNVNVRKRLDWILILPYS